MRRGAGSWPFWLLLLAAACGPADVTSSRHDVDEAVATYRGTTMGTTYAVTVVGVPTPTDPAVGDDIQRALDGVDTLMSTFDPASEVSRFNAATTTEPFPLSSDTMAVLGEALAISSETGGAFDVTVGPLVDAWGFGPSPRAAGLPTDAEIAGLLTRVGSAHLELDPHAGTARKARSELAIDLSAIAKGYAVDRVAETLTTRGVGHFMVEVGGEVRTAGLNARGGVWRIGIERPDPAGASIHRVVSCAIWPWRPPATTGASTRSTGGGSRTPSIRARAAP